MKKNCLNPIKVIHNRNVTSKIVFLEHNFCLIDFFKIFKKCENQLITDLYNYGLLNEKLVKDTKALILHHLILELCTTVLKNKGKEKNVIYYTEDLPSNFKLAEYFDCKQLQTFLCKTIEKLKKTLPIRFYKGEVMFNNIESLDRGSKNELISRIKSYISSNDYTNYSFSKAYSFTHRYNLTFLNKEYFNSIKARQLLIA